MTTDENGMEIAPRLGPVVDRLQLWMQKVAAEEPDDIPGKAARISMLNRLDTAIRLLQKCDDCRIAAGAPWRVVPDIMHSSYYPEIRIVDDGETDDPCTWRELEFNPGVAVRLFPGDVVIGGYTNSPEARPGCSAII